MHLFQEMVSWPFSKDCSSDAMFSYDNRTTRAQPREHLEESPKPRVPLSTFPFLSEEELASTLEVCMGLSVQTDV